ncbi:hypothetical protein BZA77DRAFT_311673 [Pyronema omphalodes]|nr:hypothetical protein BZA77DRAFT_311673 [Pyronema omphalodes]
MSIQELYWKAFTCFRQLLSSLGEADDNTGTLADDFGRLKVWAQNVAAHRHGTISLDHRLREASMMKKLVEDMLNDLRNALEEASKIISGEAQPEYQNIVTKIQLPEPPEISKLAEANELSLADSRKTLHTESIKAFESIETSQESELIPVDAENRCDSESPELSEVDEIAELNDLMQADPEILHFMEFNTPLFQTKTQISHIITYLYRISIAISSPAPQDRLERMPTNSMSHYLAFDIDHISNKYKFDDKDQYLLERLGKANTKRRQVFKYYQDHHQRIIGRRPTSPEAASQPGSPGLENSEIDENDFYQSVVDRSDMYTTVNTFYEGDRKFSVFKPFDLDSRSETGFSETSYASSSADSDNLRVPDPPEEAKKGPFQCPYCFIIVETESRASWKKHVFEDLRPYVCTFKDCTTASHLFSNRHDWFNHENDTHRREWFCNKCTEAFTSADNFRVHLKSNHAEIISHDQDPDQQLDIYIDRAERPIQSEQPCPLCDKKLNPRQLQSHLGRHMQQISLFSLPGVSEENGYTKSESNSDQDTTEDESSSEDSDSALNQNKKRAKFPQIANVFGQIHACLQDSFAKMECKCDKSHVVYLELPTQINDKNRSNNNKKLSTLLFAYKAESPTHPIHWCIVEFESIDYVDSSLHLIETNKSGESLAQPGESSVAGEVKQPFKRRTMSFLSTPDRKDAGDSGLGGSDGLQSSGSRRKSKSNIGQQSNKVPSHQNIIENLCSEIQTSTSSATVNDLGILSSNKYRYSYILRPRRKSEEFYNLVDTVSLSVLLDLGLINPMERLELGVILSSAVMQLQDAFWLQEFWGKADIFFLQKRYKTFDRNDLRTPIIAAKPVLNRPLLRQKFRSTPRKRRQPTTNPASSCTAILYSLGLILIELWLGHPGERDDSEWPNLSISSINEYLSAMQEDAGPLYTSAAKSCLIGIDYPIKDLNDQNFQNEAKARIVSKLRLNLDRYVKAHDESRKD